MLQGGQATWCVNQDIEVRGGWRSHGEGSALCIHLVINQTPLLQKSMNPENKQYFLKTCLRSMFKTVSTDENTSLKILKFTHTTLKQTSYRMMAHTSPVRLRLHDVELRYSCGFSRYVSIIKFRYAR